MPSSQNKKAIDCSSIEKLRQMQHPQQAYLIKSLIKVFFDSSEQNMIEIRSAIRKQDFRGLSQSAHRLKDSSANIGALRMSILCLKLEKCGTNGSQPCDLEQLCQELETEFSKAKEELLDLQTPQLKAA
jgi:HPt (histidine-containing phosphotransfer) domain-containing protein